MGVDQVDTVTAPLKVGAPRRRRFTSQSRAAIFFVVPVFIPLTIYWIIPAISALGVSLTDYSVVQRTNWVGIDNYKELWSDGLFWRSLRNTAYYAGGQIPLTMGLGLLLAVIVNGAIRGRTVFRVVFYIPLVTSSIALSMIWLWMYAPQFGLANAMMRLVGLPELQWSMDPNTAMPSLILMGLWSGVGGPMILFLAGLQIIPAHIYEAAEVDGANAWQQFWYITLPSLKPITLFIVITQIIASFQVFGPIFVMTEGGPFFATTTIVYEIYINGFRMFRMGYASSQAWVLFSILLVLALVNLKALGTQINE